MVNQIKAFIKLPGNQESFELDTFKTCTSLKKGDVYSLKMEIDYTDENYELLEKICNTAGRIFKLTFLYDFTEATFHCFMVKVTRPADPYWGIDVNDISEYGCDLVEEILTLYIEGTLI